MSRSAMPGAGRGTGPISQNGDEKAAALLHSVICNRAFVDGNKRTAWVATRVLLALYGKRPGLTEDEAYELVIRIATSCSEIEVKQIAAALAVTSVGG
jgi:death-on-curing protein